MAVAMRGRRGADDGEGGDEGGDDDGGGILLEGDVDAIGGGGDKARVAIDGLDTTWRATRRRRSVTAGISSTTRDGCPRRRAAPTASRALTLPPRNYTLVPRPAAQGQLRADLFGMQRIHKESEPEPVWVQTKTARWHQSAEFLSIIPHTVPPELCKSSEVKVSPRGGRCTCRRSAPR